MAKKKFRISPNPKTDAALTVDLKKTLASGIWKIKDLAARLHIGESRLHRLLSSLSDEACRAKEPEKACGKKCSCKGKAEKDPDLMIAVARLPKKGLFPVFLEYLAGCVETALNESFK